MEELGHQGGLVEDGAFAFGDAMGAVGVGHEAELAVVFYQLVEQHLLALVIHVVVAGAV